MDLLAVHTFHDGKNSLERPGTAIHFLRGRLRRGDGLAECRDPGQPSVTDRGGATASTTITVDLRNAPDAPRFSKPSFGFSVVIGAP